MFMQFFLLFGAHFLEIKRNTKITSEGLTVSFNNGKKFSWSIKLESI